MKFLNWNIVNLSVRKKCKLLKIHRSNLYYKSKIDISKINNLCKDVYNIWSKYQFFGYRRITQIVNQDKSDNNKINRKKILRLMKVLKIKALYPKRKTTIINKKDYKYPYLLEDKSKIDKPNHTWAIDITYIKTPVGFVYLMSLIDWKSRFVIASKLSISMETDNCIQILKKGIKNHRIIPTIINTDQGSQFTSGNWINELKKRNIQISMDSKGRWVDNVIIERFWRTVKYEQIFLNPPDDIEELRKQINKFIYFYNYQRPHQSLNYKTPSQIYYNDDKRRKRIRF